MLQEFLKSFVRKASGLSHVSRLATFRATRDSQHLLQTHEY